MIFQTFHEKSLGIWGISIIIDMRISCQQVTAAVHTVPSSFAHRLRCMEITSTVLRIKIVEFMGRNLTDLLCTSAKNRFPGG